jgi:hypothetical protein
MNEHQAEEAIHQLIAMAIFYKEIVETGALVSPEAKAAAKEQAHQLVTRLTEDWLEEER